jgi:hypothetical protein
MPKSYRVRTEVGKDKSIKVQLEQDFESLEILSLKILQSDIYNRVCADYGVVVGRITANNGLGLPNCKVSIFIPLTGEDELNPVISELYPYKTLDDVNDEGYRYNLLPYVQSHGGHTPTGTFPTRKDVLTNPTLIEIYDKYFKFTAKTNDSGDFMLFGVPLGSQTVHVDIDLSDIGEFSMAPQDLIRIGVATEKQISGLRFNSSSNLDTLPQLLSFNRVIEVYPLWGQPEVCELGITRTDFDLVKEAGITLLPAAIFMGSIVSNQDKRAIKKKCRVNRKLGNLCQLIAGPGEILAIRQTIGIDSDGYPVLEEYTLEDGGKVIDDNGTWLIDVPMNLDFVYTNEFGERTFSNDPKIGVPTKAKYRFKVKWEQPDTLQGKVKRAAFLVPNIKEWGWGGTTDDPYTFLNSEVIDCRPPNPSTDFINGRFKMVKASYAFSLDWREYGQTDLSGNLTAIGQQMVQEAVDCQDRFFEMRYNKVYTVAELISEYRSNSGRKKFVAVRDMLEESCEGTSNPFPVNDAQFQFDLLYLLMSILALIAKPILVVILFVAHIVAWMICKLKDIVCGIKKALCKLGIGCGRWTDRCNEWKDKCEDQKLFLPSLTYPDCELCECAADPAPTQTTGSLSSPYPEYGEIEVPTPLAVNYSSGTTLTTPGLIDIVTLDNPTNSACLNGPGTPTTLQRTFTMSIPYSEKLNLFNTKAKFFDEDPTDYKKNPGGGVNRIKVSFNINSTANANKYHFDNVFAMLVPPPVPNPDDGPTPDNLAPGSVLRFSDAQPPSDPNLNYYTGVTVSGYNEFGTRGITGITPSWVAASSPDDPAIGGYVFNRTITYANHQIYVLGPNNNPAERTVDYEIFVSSESLGGQKFGFDDEYFQVIYTGNVGTFLSEASSEPNSFARRFLNGGMHFVTNTFTSPGQIPPSDCETPPLGQCETYELTDQTEMIKTPLDELPDFSDYRVIFMVRGVDPHSTKVTCKYDLSALFGETLTDDGFFNPTRTVQFMAHLNIPIQPNMRATRHNLVYSYDTDSYSQNKLFFDTFGFTPDPAQFSPFRSTKPLNYSALDALNQGGAPTDAYDVFVASSFDSGSSNFGVLSVNDNNEYIRELYYTVIDPLDGNPNLAYYNASDPSDDSRYNTPTNDRNRGYFRREIVEGGSLLYIPDSNPYTYSYLAATGGATVFLDSCDEVVHQYYGVVYTTPTLGVEINTSPGGSGRDLVMRSDRIPTSNRQDNSNPNGPNTGGDGSLGVPTAPSGSANSMIGFNNPVINIVILPETGEVTGIIPPGPSSDAGDSTDNASDIPTTNGYASLANTFTCQGLIPLECYETNTAGEVYTQPLGHPCYTNNCCNDDSKSRCNGCNGANIMTYGCYTLITDPWKSRKTDRYLMNEWLLRLRISFAACRNVWGHMFTNQWVNGTLFAYPLQVQTRFTSPGIDPNDTTSIGPNQPYACYCTHLVYFDYQTNNFFYRSTPYNESIGYIGRNNPKGGFGGNQIILGNPTTIMDLGPRNDYMDELSYSEDFLGYVVNRLDSTTFQDVDELLNLFIVQRLVSASIRNIIRSSARVGGSNDPVKKYFSRNNLKVDGDYAQMIAINSQIGVIAYDSGLYLDSNDIFFGSGGVDGSVFGVFFSADTQVRDWLSPKRTIVSPGSDPIFKCTFDEFPIFSQEIPMYLWNIIDNSSGNSIFGSQTNEWYTVPISAGQFNHIPYQSIDRIDESTPFGSRTMIPRVSTNESFYMGFIHNTTLVPGTTDEYTTDAAYNVANTAGNLSEFDRGPVDNKVNNTAPFYFYFGLIKGSSAFDRFLTKWVGGDTNTF